MKKWFPLTWRGCIIVLISGAYLIISYGYSQWQASGLWQTVYRVVPANDYVWRATALIGLMLVTLSVLLVILARGIAAVKLRHLPASSVPPLDCSGKWQSTTFTLPFLRWLYGIFNFIWHG